MDSRTNIGRVRGLGSAKHGGEHGRDLGDVHLAILVGVELFREGNGRGAGGPFRLVHGLVAIHVIVGDDLLRRGNVLRQGRGGKSQQQERRGGCDVFHVENLICYLEMMRCASAQ